MQTLHLYKHLVDAVKNEGHDSILVSALTEEGVSAMEWADVIVLYRCFTAPLLQRIVDLQARGKLCIYFIDDYIFQPNFKYCCIEHKNMCIEYMSRVNVMMASNMRLLEKMPQKLRILRRTVMDNSVFDLLGKKNNSIISHDYSVGYLAGVGRALIDDVGVDMILKKLDVCLNHREHVNLHCFGKHRFSGLKNITVIEHGVFQLGHIIDYYKYCVSMNFVVVINYLDELDEFSHCKTELKYIETGAMGVPLITSRVFPFTEIIKDGENGFFASSPQEFADKILLVCRDNELARRVGEKAREHIGRDYDCANNARQFIGDIQKIIKTGGVSWHRLQQ